MTFKNFVLSIFMAVGFLSFAQKTFSGTQVITYSYEGEGAEMMAQYMPQGMISYFGKDKSAVDFKGAAMEAMMNRVVTTPTESFAVNDAKKHVYALDKEFVDANQPEMENLDVTKVDGETKDILGYSCEKYLVSMTQMGIKLSMVMWVTNQYALPEYEVPFSQDASFEVLKQANIKGLVLRLESDIPVPGANIKMIMETTKLDPKPVDESLFEKPAGYAEKKFADMQLGGY